MKICMARIRSVHPGLFTDAAFVSATDSAQIFYIGLLTQADDAGIFEWKPLELKMRLRPAATYMVDDLLSELASANLIQRYELNGRPYGAVRNFCRYQRPKKPKHIHPITPEIETYVAISARSSELDTDERHEVLPKTELGRT